MMMIIIIVTITVLVAKTAKRCLCTEATEGVWQGSSRRWELDLRVGHAPSPTWDLHVIIFYPIF